MFAAPPNICNHFDIHSVLRLSIMPETIGNTQQVAIELHSHLKDIISVYVASKEFTQLTQGRRSHNAMLCMQLLNLTEKLKDDTRA